MCRVKERTFLTLVLGINRRLCAVCLPFLFSVYIQGDTSAVKRSEVKWSYLKRETEEMVPDYSVQVVKLFPLTWRAQQDHEKKRCRGGDSRWEPRTPLLAGSLLLHTIEGNGIPEWEWSIGCDLGNVSLRRKSVPTNKYESRDHMPIHSNPPSSPPNPPLFFVLPCPYRIVHKIKYALCGRRKVSRQLHMVSVSMFACSTQHLEFWLCSSCDYQWRSI